MKKETEFLGHLVTTTGITPNPTFANIVKPMTTKLKKGATINTKDKPYIDVFEKMKILITSDPILIYPMLGRDAGIVKTSLMFVC